MRLFVKMRLITNLLTKFFFVTNITHIKFRASSIGAETILAHITSLEQAWAQSAKDVGAVGAETIADAAASELPTAPLSSP